MLGLPDMFKTFGIAAASAIMVCAAYSGGPGFLSACLRVGDALGIEVLAQLTFVAPVLAILPWLGPDAGNPAEVEPLSPTGLGNIA